MKKLTVRFNDKEYEEMTEKKLSLQFNITNDFIKAMIFGRKTHENILRMYWREFGEQGNNINQIAYKLNSNNFSFVELKELMEIIIKQQKELFKNVDKQFS